MTKDKIKLAIFASGGGSNAKKIVEYFQNHPLIETGVMLTNNPDSGVIKLGDTYHIPTIYLPSSDFRDSARLQTILAAHEIQYIILAGFLRKIPESLIQIYNHKIINIHPALLPKYGGKGMYGHHVHEAVKAAGDTISGCTIHLVNEAYDKGRILAQFSVDLEREMTPDDIAAAVLKLEHAHYSTVIEHYILANENLFS